MSNFKSLYKETIVPKLMEHFKYENINEVPAIEKVTVNMGLGKASREKKVLERAVGELEVITGQKPVVTKARKSIAGFKLRDGMAIGAKVTLRGDRMFEFLERLVCVALPRIRDFRGLNPNSFDGRGNYTFGVQEQIIFPEIDFDKIDELRGMDICITTSAKSNDEGRELLKLFNFPLKETAKEHAHG